MLIFINSTMAFDKVATDLEFSDGFLWVLRFPPTVKLASHDLAAIR